MSDEDRTCNDGEEPIRVPEPSPVELQRLAELGPLHDLRNMGDPEAMLVDLAQITGGIPDFAKAALAKIMDAEAVEAADRAGREAAARRADDD